MYHRITEDGKILTAARKFTAMAISLTVIVLFLRFYEMIASAYAGGFPVGTWKMMLLGLHFDVVLLLKLLSFLLIPFMLIAYFSLNASKYLFTLFNVLVTFISLGLQQYFLKSLLPLGADLWGYSLSELKLTVGSSGAVSITTFIPFLALGTLSVFLSLNIFKLELKRIYSFLFCIFILIILTIDFNYIPKASKSTTEFNRYIQSNKLGFFIASNLDYFEKKRQKERELKDMDAAISGQIGTSVKLIDKNYPFLHKNEAPDVLSQFFATNKQLPNLVFIIVESLGRSYSGEGAVLGSFTPFLESLMAKSLYWENFLSTSGRTFGVMPSIFGSLPFGENGFAEMGVKMPKHISLMSILNKNAYQSSFYYGSDSEFDNMALFFKKQNTSNFIDQTKFGKQYKKMPAMSSGFTWGYGDKELFDKYLSTIEGKNPDEPRLDVMLTISMHSPFLLPEQAKYNKKFESHLKSLKISEDKKKYNRQYAAQLATVLCFDDELKHFFEEYTKREDYKNTIFFITGDHRMPEIPISSQLDRFHVPFLIYSPMLKKAQKFSSISTHFDIAPSILAFLCTNYKIQLPSIVSWIGTGLDVEPKFRNIHSYPLMRNKSELVDYIDNKNMLSNGILYEIFPNNNIDQVQDSKRLKEISDKFETFKKNNLFACKRNKIVPDSIVTKY